MNLASLLRFLWTLHPCRRKKGTSWKYISFQADDQMQHVWHPDVVLYVVRGSVALLSTKMV